MNITIIPAWIALEGPEHLLQDIDDTFSYKDKSAQYAIGRFIKAEKFRQSRMGEKPEWYDDWYRKQITKLTAAVHVKCCRRDGNLLMVPIGLHDRLIQKLQALEIQYIVEDLRDFEPNRKHLGQKGDKKNLRKPQQEALEALEGKTCGLLKIATGVGKTVLGEELIAKLGCKTIFLVPSTPILNQTVRRFRARFGDKLVGEYSGKKKQDAWITVATYQSVYAAKEPFDDIQMVLADEVHHVAADTFFGAVVDKIPNAVYRFGLTADEERADGGIILVNAAVGDVIYRYTAAQAIEDGYLAKPTYLIYNVYRTTGTFKKWKIKNKKRIEIGVAQSFATNDSDEGRCYKNWVLGNDLLTAKIAQMAKSFVQDGLSVLILIDEKEHADKFIPHFSDIEYGVCVGGGKENESLIKRFNQRDLRLLMGTSTLGEGTDLIPVDIMIQLQGGASRSKTRQADGRALRNDPDPDTHEPRKPTALVIDFSFPMCDTLSRHAKIRQEIHQETGEVSVETLDV